MILVVDVGTSSVKFVLMNEIGAPKYICGEKYTLVYPTEQAVEMDVRDFTTHLFTGLKKVGAYCTEQNITLQAVSVTSQRSSVIPVTVEGTPLSHALMWQDTRSQHICDALIPRFDAIRAISGMTATPTYSAPKMAYLKQTMADVYHAAFKLIGFCEYALFQLTGAWATDISIASRTSLFDIKSLAWSSDLLALFDIDKKKLCPLIEVGSIVDQTIPMVTRLLGQDNPIPVYSAGGDQQCAALGNGTLETGDISANFGSGAYVLGLIDHPSIPEQSNVVCNVSAIPGKWQIESSFSSCGMTLDWIDRMLFKNQNEPHPYANFMEASRRSPIGSHGVRFSIHLAGKKNALGKIVSYGGIFNINHAITKDDIARSVLEGIACSFDEHLGAVRSELNTIPDEVGISGGLAKDPFFNQMVGSTIGFEVTTLDNPEATASGAWISTAKRIGLYDSEAKAFATMAGHLKRIRYASIKAEHDTYQKIKVELTQFTDSIPETITFGGYKNGKTQCNHP